MNAVLCHYCGEPITPKPGKKFARPDRQYCDDVCAQRAAYERRKLRKGDALRTR